MTRGSSRLSSRPVDVQYERMRRHLSRRAVGVSLLSVAVGVGVLLSVPGLPGPLHQQVWVPMAGPAFETPAQSCTAADLAKPGLTVMPTPRQVTRPLTVHPGPDFEQLTPPDAAPVVAASQAWAVMRSRAIVAPTTAGSTQVLLGDLYASTPVVETPSRQALPVFSDRLVWAIYDSHQPARLAGSAPGTASPACYFESAVFYVDALTGRPLVAEVFLSPMDPASTI